MATLQQADRLLDAIVTLKQVQAEGRLADEDDKNRLWPFPGFGILALDLFPHAVHNTWKTPAWEERGRKLQALLTEEEYRSAKRATFSQFFTSPFIMQALVNGLQQCGLPDDSLILEPGCGHGAFFAHLPSGIQAIGIEQELVTAQIARMLWQPEHEIYATDLRSAPVWPRRFDAALGNVPFADIPYDYWGMRLSLHEYFLARSITALKPGGLLAMVMTHSLLDKQDSTFRVQLHQSARLLAAFRLPRSAFEAQGTSVITDLLFMQRYRDGETHDAEAAWPWLETGTQEIEGVKVALSRYFLDNPTHVLGTYTRKHTLWGKEDGYSILPDDDWQGTLLHLMAARLPARGPVQAPQFQARLVPSVQPCTPTQKSCQTLPGLGAETQATPETLSILVQEGNFYLGEDGAILQRQEGMGVPTGIDADGAVHQRVAALIGLRDAARYALHTQQMRQPLAVREEARAMLCRLYARFVQRWGHINKTVTTVTSKGIVIRRLPNLLTFKHDPDAMLVMMLEKYVEETDTATPADIMTVDVVMPEEPKTSAASAEEALLHVLNTQGVVDLPAMARLYPKPEAEIVAELGDLVYQDPTTQAWETADVYLSGMVRVKLGAALVAGEAFQRNVDALRAVQPPDLLPGSIDANLGAPWIPLDVIHTFAMELFGGAEDTPAAIQIAFLPSEALWSVKAWTWMTNSPQAKAQWGTERRHGLWLLEDGLNQRLPRVYDPVMGLDGKKHDVLNETETAAAQAKLQALKIKFTSWVFQDIDRAERLVRIYNDIHNGIRLREFNGEHLTFPGMTPTITLTSDQKAGVWRMMTGGSTLLGLDTGGGKTYSAAAGVTKMVQAGMIQKPIIVVPNHMLEEWGREFLRLYPMARLLVANKEDCTPARRKLLVARMAASRWDAIIMTHSSFERLPMSPAVQERFLRAKIEEYERLATEYEAAMEDDNRAARNILKQIETKKVKYEDKLEAMLALERKDDGLCFDQLGIDYLVVDESQAFKNLDTATKLQHVAGIQSGGSDRAFDMAVKCWWLHEQHPGHGMTFLSATPVTNTLVELYNLERMLRPDSLEARGLTHFDNWAATHGNIVQVREIAPDGRTLRERSRFAEFVNFAELQMAFRSFAVIKSKEAMGLEIPALEGGEPQVIACPMSPEQERLQQRLVTRYEDIRNGLVKPWEDNALAVTTDGRKLALDARMLDKNAPAYAASKIVVCAQMVFDIWVATREERATQLVFCDLGVNPTAWDFAVYHELRGLWLAWGMPQDDIVFAGAANTDAKKYLMQQRMQEGRTGVLLGSTERLGTGINVQHRLLATHDLDAPWRPDQVRQRLGRMLRQFNRYYALGIPVKAFRYVTQASFDAVIWQALETKARAHGPLLAGDLTVRRVEDYDETVLSYGKVKAIASGNDAMMALANADADIHDLTLRQMQHHDAQYHARQGLRSLPARLEAGRTKAKDWTADMATLEDHPVEEARYLIADKAYTTEEAMEFLTQRLTHVALQGKQHDLPIGSYRGLAFGLTISPMARPGVYVQGASRRETDMDKRMGLGYAVVSAVTHIQRRYQLLIDEWAKDEDYFLRREATYEAHLATPFAEEAHLETLTALRDSLRVALSEKPPAGHATAAEVAAQIEDLRRAHSHPQGEALEVEQQVMSMAPATTAQLLQHMRERQEALAPVEPLEEEIAIEVTEEEPEIVMEEDEAIVMVEDDGDEAPILEEDAVIPVLVMSPAQMGQAKARIERRGRRWVDERQLELSLA